MNVEVVESIYGEIYYSGCTGGYVESYPRKPFKIDDVQNDTSLDIQVLLNWVSLNVRLLSIHEVKSLLINCRMS